MRIEELIIDGFKSYASHTVISGWDAQFNCITGLNGSGKSNILDAICFVLGITNMSTVRAQNLHDLIYKRGTAGVTKASVTIVFDNKDSKRSPIGFETFAQISVTRQVLLGGTSKYLINGHRAQQHAVQNLFQSVGLNINNPNFLIMQGRITKVLNMKATEVLSMIEEAAGTRMFEDRKDKAFKTMSKKDNKVQEINSLLADEIEPKLEKLRSEMRAFLELQQTQSDLERLTKVVVAHDYVKLCERKQKWNSDNDGKRSRLAALEASISQKQSEIASIEKEIASIKARREAEMKKGGRAQQLEKQEKELSHQLIRVTTSIELKNNTAVEYEQRKIAAGKAVNELDAQLQKEVQSLEKQHKSYQALKKDYDALSDDASKQEELLQTLTVGISSKEGVNNGYMNQLQDARNSLSTVCTQQQQAKIKINHLQKGIKDMEPKAKKAQLDVNALRKALEKSKVEAQTLENELKALGWVEGADEKLAQEQAAIHSRVRELTAKTEALRKKVANVDFTYTDPTANFDRSKVRGVVAQLFSLDKENFDAATALEVSAGGRLYNVVVDSEVTATQLLQNGKLRKRVTIIPLNKISAFKASAEKIGAAKRVAPGKVDLALSLIGYDKEIAVAMEYVFGSTFVCKDAATAKKVTFDEAIKMKSVTFEGDIYDPAGTLSGGSAPQSNSVLITLQKLNELTRQLESEKALLERLRAAKAQDEKRADQARKMKHQLDLRKHEIELSEKQIASNASSSIINELEGMKATVQQLQDEESNAVQQQATLNQEIKNIENDMSEFKNNKTSKLDELRKRLEKMKVQLKQELGAVETSHTDYQNQKLDKEQCESDLEAARESLLNIVNELQSERADIRVLEKTQSEYKEEYDRVVAELEDERSKLTGFDEELHELQTAGSTKKDQQEKDRRELGKLQHELDRSEKDAGSIEQQLGQLESEHDWIAESKDMFGRAGTPYDYSKHDLAECRRNLRDVSARYNSMRKKVNDKVMNMIGSVEKKEKSLQEMLRTVIKDRSKIEETITTLDEYKREALEKTWTKVNADFGNIFAELLPGSFAKLEPPEGKELTDGLEVKVCLGKVWKESLTELSGGQRSLIALSLIMALLQFKPAPMYILDEVDAALDLSHTQNIGRLIKTRFKGSQFIVVSLKEGFFSNANRVFRTRFQEGMSVVQVL